MKARTKMKTLLLLGVLLFGFTVSAQSQKVSLDFKNERVEKVLASIKSQTGMSLVFSDQLVDVNRKVTMQLKDVTLKEALTRLLSGTDLTFEIRNNKIYFIDLLPVGQALHRQDVFSLQLIRLRNTGLGGLAVDQHRAGAAGALAASVLHRGQAQLVSQEPQQLLIFLSGYRFAVYRKNSHVGSPLQKVNLLFLEFII